MRRFQRLTVFLEGVSNGRFSMEAKKQAVGNKALNDRLMEECGSYQKSGRGGRRQLFTVPTRVFNEDNFS